MSTKTPDRIVELWPLLDEAARQELIKLAESGVVTDLDLTPDEERLLAEAQADFENGRVLNTHEYRASMAAFFEELKAKTRPRL